MPVRHALTLPALWLACAWLPVLAQPAQAQPTAQAAQTAQIAQIAQTAQTAQTAGQGATAPNQAPQDAAPPPLPLWEVGLFGFGVSQMAYPGAAERTRRAFALPFAIYRGRYLRVDESTVGVRALNTPTVELDIGLSGSFGASSNAVEIRRGMPSLGTLFEFGPRLRLNLPAPLPASRLRLTLPLRAVLDVSAQFRSRGVSFEPELEFSQRLAGGTRVGAKLGLILGDRALNEHLYGVAPQYVAAGRPAYAGQAGLIAKRLSVSSATPLSRDWDVFTFARYDSVSGAANQASPLVRSAGGATVGVGLAWTFWRSDRLAAE